MPKSPLKKTVSKKPVAAKAKKATPKKVTATKATPKKVAKTPPPQAHKSFMWKLLERKQMELKRMATQPKHPFAHADAKIGGAGKVHGHARYNGPRRKAA